MKLLLKIIYESANQALQQLRGNKLRTFLSLLGITIGIFCIIGVKAAVDSLETNVRGSFDKLGSDVIYVRKWSWSDSHQYWWKYLKRPEPNYQDYKTVAKKVKSLDKVSYHVAIGFRTVKYRSSSVEQSVLIGATYDFAEMFSIEFEKGRHFSQTEYTYGSNKILLGYTVAEELFGTIDPIGKEIKVSGRKLEVIGVIKKSGDDLINVVDFDDAIIVSYELARKFANLKSKNVFQTSINIKASEGVELDQLKDEVTGVMRAAHKLKPKQEDDFSLNELTMMTSLLDGFFSVLSLLGWIIGGFAILVGAFSVANIMFVSVKERTNIIGIKKALGAKRYVILLEFLIESIILCIIGGVLGLGLIGLTTLALSQVADFDVFLSFSNMLLGVGVSIAIGLLSGIIPAHQASGMDPVDAIRSK
ncbi:MAG: ABC transporter permease [Saprospiraceae bacterium]